VGTFTAKDKRKTSAAGIEFMDAAHQAMIISRTLNSAAEATSLAGKSFGHGT
jgi:hypothetical protein